MPGQDPLRFLQRLGTGGVEATDDDDQRSGLRQAEQSGVPRFASTPWVST